MTQAVLTSYLGPFCTTCSL